MSDHCARAGCTRKGEWSIEAKIPAKGWSLDAHTPMSIICDVPLCRDHAAEENLLTMLPDLKDIIRNMLASGGYAEPDFDRAWTVPIRRSSPRFLEFERQQSGKEH